MLKASFREEVLAQVTVILLPLCFKVYFLKSSTTVPKVINSSLQYSLPLSRLICFLVKENAFIFFATE